MGLFAYFCFVGLPVIFGIAFREIRPAIAGLMLGTVVFVVGAMWTVIDEATDSSHCTYSDTSGCD